jgi:micrococcal nuclease
MEVNKMFKLILITILLKPALLHAEDLKIKKEQIVKIYDGDTFFINIDNTLDVFGKNLGVRIKGVDTPEIRGKCSQEKFKAILAKEYLKKSLDKANCIILKNLERGKYFRVLADLYIDGENIADKLLSQNLAVKYQGGKKHNFCIN